MLIEFERHNVSLLTLSSVKYDIMDTLHKEIDVIHGPLEDAAIIQITKLVNIYGE